MTENPVPFPASPYCQVRARVASIWADGIDPDTNPDWRPAAGEKVVLTPSIGSQLLTYDVGGADPIIVTVERVDCVVGDDGLLTTPDGRPVYIAPTDDPLLSATGWTWTASIKGKSVVFAAPTGGVVDLAVFIAAPATGNTQMWVERIPELVALAESLVGIESITQDGMDLVILLSDGREIRFPIPSGESFPVTTSPFTLHEAENAYSPEEGVEVTSSEEVSIGYDIEDQSLVRGKLEHHSDYGDGFFELRTSYKVGTGSFLLNTRIREGEDEFSSTRFEYVEVLAGGISGYRIITFEDVESLDDMMDEPSSEIGYGITPYEIVSVRDGNRREYHFPEISPGGATSERNTLATREWIEENYGPPTVSQG